MLPIQSTQCCREIVGTARGIRKTENLTGDRFLTYYFVAFDFDLICFECISPETIFYLKFCTGICQLQFGFLQFYEIDKSNEM